MRADVDAARGLIEDKQVRFGREPTGENGLLLIAAGKELYRLLAIGGSDIECPDVEVREPVLLHTRDRPGPAAPCLQGEDDVLAHGEVADDAGGLAVFRQKPNFCRMAARGEERSTVRPSTLAVPLSAR